MKNEHMSSKTRYTCGRSSCKTSVWHKRMLDLNKKNFQEKLRFIGRNVCLSKESHQYVLLAAVSGHLYDTEKLVTWLATLVDC